MDLTDTHQIIRGFGGTDAWLPPFSGAESDLPFGNGSGEIGLSIYRMRIAPDGAWADETSNAQRAAARDAAVIATPWSPPAGMKTNSNVVGGDVRIAGGDLAPAKGQPVQVSGIAHLKLTRGAMPREIFFRPAPTTLC
ncbi:MAG TPA: hypothetical protein VG710_07690 [Opitutus sp.]|nr:hypothetical protein [Opitutus sp.]